MYRERWKSYLTIVIKQKAVEAACIVLETSGVSTEQYTLVISHRELSLKLTRKLPCWGAFIVSERAMYTPAGEKMSVVFPSTGPCILQYRPARQGAPTGAIEI